MKKDGQICRLTTDDTVQAWLQENPVVSKNLIVSAQPFIRRQTQIFETIFTDSFEFVPSGPCAEENLSIALYLDELARALYQEQKKYINSSKF